MTKADERKCSNCGHAVKMADAIIVQKVGRVIVFLCADCQQAKKIQVTLEKRDGEWYFSQFFPVEA